MSARHSSKSDGGLHSDHAYSTVYYVYFLRSENNPDQTYIGLTANLKKRLQKHNYGEVAHTSKYKPWQLVSYTAFQTREHAARFETYLKSGSGRAFAKRHIWSAPPTRQK